MRTDSQVSERGTPVKDTPRWLGRLTFVRWVLLSHVLVGLPLLGLAVWVTLALLNEREATQQQALQRRTDVTASAMARKLDSTQVQLSSLLLSRSATAQRSEAGVPGPAELAQLRELAGRLVAADPDLMAVHAWGRAGPPLFVVGAEAAQLPPAGLAPLLDGPGWATLDRGEAWLLPLQGLTLPGGPQVVHLCLPWTEPLRSSLALCASLRRSSFATVLLDQRWREDWVVALLDSQCHIVARSINEAALLGRRAVAPMCQHIQRATAEGEAYQPNLVRARTLDGVESIGTAARVPRTAWWVAVGIPAQSVRDMAVGPLQRLLWGAAVAVLVAALGAFGLARSLVRQVAAAADQDDSQPLIVRELAQIAQRRHHAQRALHQARHDDLTSLPGRALFLEQLDTLVVAARTHAPTDVALLFLDLDGLKQTNDQIGHEAGDHLLQCTGHLLQSQLRQGDIAGRLGGDEFAVAFSGDPDTLGSAAHEVAQRLLRAVAGLGPGVGCSIGLARARPDQPPAQLLARADQAMLTAKRAGKNRVVEAD